MPKKVKRKKCQCEELRKQNKLLREQLLRDKTAYIECVSNS
jgi:hypothetical protein